MEIKTVVHSRELKIWGKQYGEVVGVQFLIEHEGCIVSLISLCGTQYEAEWENRDGTKSEYTAVSVIWEAYSYANPKWQKRYFSFEEAMDSIKRYLRKKHQRESTALL